MADWPILYSFRRCPYAMRARMALRVGGHQLELREIVLRDKPAAMLAASPKGTVPVLALPDGRVIDESRDIMHWALAETDMGPMDAEATHLIETNDGPFKFHLDRFKYPNRYSNCAPLEHRSAGYAVLTSIDARLAFGPWLGGEKLGFLDIAIFPFIRQFAATDAEWFAAQAVPNLQRWMAAMTGSNLFKSVMDRYQPWRDGDPPTLFHQNEFFSH